MTEPDPLDPRVELADWDERFRKACPHAWGLGTYLAENIPGFTIHGHKPRFVMVRDGEPVGVDRPLPGQGRARLD